MAQNNRIFYAIQQVGFAINGTTNFIAAHGVQSVGITTTFDLTQVFEEGQQEIYDLIEGLPNIEVTMEKALDGNPLLYHLATHGASFNTLAGRSNVQTNIGLSVFADSQTSASGTPIAEVQMSGMYVSSLNYAFPTDGSSTESITLVGNNKVWRDVGTVFLGAFPGNNDAPIASGGHVQQRWNMVFNPTASGTTLDANGQAIALNTILPRDIYGISSDGTNPIWAAGSGAHIQNITVSCDLGRDQILQLGAKAPYSRPEAPVIEVTTEITVIGTKWDGISATEAGGQNGAPPGSNLNNQSIRIYMQDGTYITTGTRNKLNSTSYGGGDAGGGGGNVSLTYRYVTYNNLTVQHPADPTAGFGTLVPM